MNLNKKIFIFSIILLTPCFVLAWEQLTLEPEDQEYDVQKLNITRAEALPILIKVNNITDYDECKGLFVDLTEGINCKYAEALLKAWLLRANSKFNPNRNINEYEFLSIINNNKWILTKNDAIKIILDNRKIKDQDNNKNNLISEKKDNLNQRIEPNNTNIDSDKTAKIQELNRSLENSINYLKKSINSENVEEIKTKAENLKKEYIQKFEDLNLPQYKEIIENKFQAFLKNSFDKKENLKK